MYLCHDTHTPAEIVVERSNYVFVIFALAVYTSAFNFHIPPLPSLPSPPPFPLPSLPLPPSPLPSHLPLPPLLHPHVAMRPRFFNLRPVKMRTLGEEPPEEEDSTFAEVCHSVLLGYQGPDGQDYAVFHQSIVFLFGSVLQSSDSHFEGSPFQKVLVSCVHTVGVSYRECCTQWGCHSIQGWGNYRGVIQSWLH